MPRRAVLLVASASALLAPQTRVTHTRLHSTTLNPLEQLAEQAQIKAYEASAAAIAATISATADNTLGGSCDDELRVAAHQGHLYETQPKVAWRQPRG